VLLIRDARSGAAIATGATVTARELTLGQTYDVTGQRFDTLRVFVGGEPGIYDVTVAKPGYITWSQADIKVDSLAFPSGCQPDTRTLDVTLQPAG
jgi:hypothetical protein